MKLYNIGFEKFEEDFVADINTALIKYSTDKTPTENTKKSPCDDCREWCCTLCPHFKIISEE